MISRRYHRPRRYDYRRESRGFVLELHRTDADHRPPRHHLAGRGSQVSQVGSSWGLRPGSRDGGASGSGSLSAKVG